MSKLTKLIAGIAAFAAVAVGGGAIAAAASNGGPSSSSQSSTASPARPPANMPAHGTAAHENAEQAVTGAAAVKAKAAAVKAAGGGTAGDVTTDFKGDGYEVTVQKSDGTSVEIHLDGSFSVRQGPGGLGAAPPAASGSIAPAA